MRTPRRRFLLHFEPNLILFGLGTQLGQTLPLIKFNDRFSSIHDTPLQMLGIHVTRHTLAIKYALDYCGSGTNLWDWCDPVTVQLLASVYRIGFDIFEPFPFPEITG